MEHLHDSTYNECRQLLEDYLEIKFSPQKSDIVPVVERLLQDTNGDPCEVSVVDTLLFNNTAIMIKDETAGQMAHLLVLDAASKEKMFFYDFLDEMDAV